jgi:hypothetical protein
MQAADSTLRCGAHARRLLGHAPERWLAIKAGILCA